MVGLSAPMVTRYSRLSVQRENALAAVIHLDRTKVEREKKDRTRNLG
jgi:stalled ribosome alternative rescue factor ArfA